MDLRIVCEEGKLDGTRIYHIRDGYFYQLRMHTESTIYFRCCQSSCRGRALLKYGLEFQHTQRHNHPPDMLRTEVFAHRQAIVDESRSIDHVSFSEIIRAEQRRIVNPEVRQQLTLRRLRPAMQRARADAFPCVPDDLMELAEILEDPAWQHLSSTVDFEGSIYLGSTVGRDGSQSIVFISQRCLQLLRMADIVFADGTFYITPSVDGCYQVFTLVVIHGHTVIPLCWVLMERKTQAAYESVLGLLRDHLITWTFTLVICDFEDAMINAFRIIFGVQVQGCLFHAADAMARYAQTNIGLAFIRQHPEVELVVRLCCALPLLPQHLLQQGLNVIGTEAMNLGAFLYGVLRPFLHYVQVEWLYHPNRGTTLSVFGSKHRTNNASESNNRRMKRRIGVHHPNTFHLIRQFASFEFESFDDVGTLTRGLIPTRHRSVSAVSNDEFIRQISLNLLSVPNPSDESILTFLCGAALSTKGIADEHFQ